MDIFYLDHVSLSDFLSFASLCVLLYNPWMIPHILMKGAKYLEPVLGIEKTLIFVDTVGSNPNRFLGAYVIGVFSKEKGWIGSS